MAKKVLILPSNLEAERTVLGSVLVSGETAATAFSSLLKSDFSGTDRRNVLLFEAMEELVKQNEPIDVGTVVNELTILHTLEDAGSIAYIRSLIDDLISDEDIDHYIKILKNNAVLRSFLLELQKAQDDYIDGKVSDVGEFIAAETNRFSEIASRRAVADFKPAKELAEEVRILIDQESRRDHKGLTGVDTGFEKLNSLTHGWQKGTLNILAARPAVGKTALALNLAVNAAKGLHAPGAVFECEMSGAEMMKRILSSQSMVYLENLSTGFMNQREKEKLASTIDDVKRMPLYFDDTSNIKLNDLIAKATKLKKENPNLCLIVVDYVGLVTVDNGKYDSRTLEIGTVTKALKKLARDLKLAVLALAQLNRNVDNNEGGVPMLSNLRESGSIEQDADIVMLMYRSDYYDNQGKPKQKGGGKPNTYAAGGSFASSLQSQVDAQNARGENKDSISVVNVNVAKNRSGRMGNVSLLFSKSFQRFDNPTKEFEEREAKKMGLSADLE